MKKAAARKRLLKLDKQDLVSLRRFSLAVARIPESEMMRQGQQMVR